MRVAGWLVAAGRQCVAQAIFTEMDRLQINYERVQDRIADAAARAGRSVDQIKLVAVCKQRPLAEVAAIYAAGQRDFGENRVEECAPKAVAAAAEFEIAGDAIRWHMIGHVQSRKAQQVAEVCGLVHSVDGLKLAARLGRSAVQANRLLPVLLECNVSGEQSKEGLQANDCAAGSAQWEQLVREVAAIAETPGVQVRGLMTMAPVVVEPDAARPFFVALRILRDRLLAQFGDLALPELSMGMTDDFEVAISEGATIVRVGRAIFSD